MSAVASRFLPRFRAMEESDLNRVMAIERAAYDYPWTDGIFRDCIRTGYVCQVYENDDDIIGYGIMSVAAGECHILNVCIRPDCQGGGHGTRIMHHLLAIGRNNKGRIAFLEVRVSNERAFALYHGLGFNEIGVRKDYYPAANGGRENGIVLAKVLA